MVTETKKRELPAHYKTAWGIVDDEYFMAFVKILENCCDSLPTGDCFDCQHFISCDSLFNGLTNTCDDRKLKQSEYQLFLDRWRALRNQ